MFEKLTELFREGQRQEGTRTLVEWTGDGSWGWWEEAHVGCSRGSNECGRATCWCWGAGLNAGEEVPREGGADGRGAGVSGWLWAGGRILIFQRDRRTGARMAEDADHR